ncbi:MAG: xanthine dehydrogenase family protein molybdopterin-binding subunit [Cloacibacillus sp.]
MADVHYEKGDYTVIGSRQPYLDAKDKVTGRLNYVSDIHLAGMLHGRALRSPYPHAKILSIDISEALKVPGIKCVLTGKNVEQQKWGPATKDEYLLAVDKVNFVGDEVAAVAGVDEESCEEALSKIKVEYEVLPAVLNMHDAMKEGAPLIHPEFPNNVNHHLFIPRGDIDEVFKNAYYVHEGKYETSLEYQAYIEPMGGVSTWDSNGNLTIYAGIQTPTWSRYDYAVALNIPVEKIRIVQPPFGGGFGAKLSQQVHPLGALLSKYAQQPVRFFLDRVEDFQCGLPRVPMYMDIKTAWSKEGKYLGKKVNILADNGAYGSYGIPIVLTAMYRIDIMYQVSVLHSECNLVYTNKVPTGCFRGFGNSQMHFVHETHLDEVAEHLNIAPDELRLRNIAVPGYLNPHGWKTNSVEIEKCIEQGVGDSNFHEKRKKYSAMNTANDDHIKKGIGMAATVHVSGNRSFIKPFEGAAVLLRMNEQGKIYIYSNEPDMGQGIRTTLSMCVADALKVDFEHICVPDPDSNIVPFGLGCFASRGTYMATGAMRMAVDDMKSKLITLAADVLNVDEKDLELKEGAVVCISDPSKKAPYAELAWKHVCDNPGQHILGIGHFTPAGVEYPDATKYNNISGGYAFGCHVAEVEVNTKTGQIKVPELWGIHDVGQAINKLALEGQIQGGMAQGYGWALMEHLRHNDKGKVINACFLDYQLPTAADIPVIHADVVDSFEWTTGFGAKSIGECCFNATAPAIQNAIYNAIGIRFNELPITAEKVLKALNEKKAEEGK